VQADNLGTGLPQTVVALVISNLARAGHPSRVRIDLATPDGRRSGLRTDSVVMTDNLATVLDTEIDRIVGSLAGHAGVDDAPRHTLGL